MIFNRRDELLRHFENLSKLGRTIPPDELSDGFRWVFGNGAKPQRNFYQPRCQRIATKGHSEMHSDDTMTIEQVAELSGLGIRTILRACKANELNRLKVQSGRTQKLIFNRAEVERWANARKEKRVFVPSVEPGPAHSDNEVTAVAPRYGTVTTQRPTQLTLPGSEALVEQIGQSVGKVVVEALKTPAVPLADKRTLSTAEAAQLFGLPEAVIRRAYKDGALRGRKVGRGVRYLPADLDAFTRGLFD